MWLRECSRWSSEPGKQSGCRTATCEPRGARAPSEAPRVHVWACVYVLPSPPPSPRPTPRCHRHSSAHPTFSAEVASVLAPVVRAGSCCQCPCCVPSIPSRVMICFARLAIWACTAACPLLFGRPWCQAGLPVKTLWVVQDPCHLGWC